MSGRRVGVLLRVVGVLVVPLLVAGCGADTGSGTDSGADGTAGDATPAEGDSDAWQPADDVRVVAASDAPPTEGTPFGPGRVAGETPTDATWFEPVDSFELPDGGTGTVVADRGPAVLACTTWDMAGPDRGCTVSVGHVEDGRFHYDLGLGTDRFQRPGRDMEVFLLPTWTREGPRTLVVAGGGQPVDSAVVVLADGEEVPATVTEGIGAPTGSLVFATVDGEDDEVAEVVTRDAGGAVLERHEVEPCRGGVECEVR